MQQLEGKGGSFELVVLFLCFIQWLIIERFGTKVSKQTSRRARIVDCL